jgi:uncharacterized protein YgfB (UPF0149 family)
VLHRLQAANHCFHPRTHLLVLLQQRGTFRHHRILSLTQCSVFFLQLRDQRDQFIQAAFELLQLLSGAGLSGGRRGVHAADYAAGFEEGQTTAAESKLRGRLVQDWRTMRLVAGLGANISAMLQVTFDEVVRVLEELESSVPAAEAHGCLVGALCTTPHYPMERWLEEIIPDEDRRVDDDSQQALRLLYADTLNALRGEDMDFEVLLPGDEVPLAARAGGLSQWCQGFLYGFGSSGQIHGAARKQEDLPANVNEILSDLTHIGRASVEIEGDPENESEEEAYAEVVEYVRVGVQLIHDELIPAQAQRADVGEAGDPPLDTDDSQDTDPSILH